MSTFFEEHVKLRGKEIERESESEKEEIMSLDETNNRIAAKREICWLGAKICYEIYIRSLLLNFNLVHF